MKSYHLVRNKNLIKSSGHKLQARRANNSSMEGKCWYISHHGMCRPNKETSRWYSTVVWNIEEYLPTRNWWLDLTYPLIVGIVIWFRQKPVAECSGMQATLEAGLRSGVNSIPLGEKQSFNRWMNCVTTHNLANGQEPD